MPIVARSYAINICCTSFLRDTFSQVTATNLATTHIEPSSIQHVVDMPPLKTLGAPVNLVAVKLSGARYCDSLCGTTQIAHIPSRQTPVSNSASWNTKNIQSLLSCNICSSMSSHQIRWHRGPRPSLSDLPAFKSSNLFANSDAPRIWAKWNASQMQSGYLRNKRKHSHSNRLVGTCPVGNDNISLRTIELTQKFSLNQSLLSVEVQTYSR